MLYDVQRILSINDRAGEKGIPASVNSKFTARSNSMKLEQDILASIDTLLTSHYALSTEELHAIFNKTEVSD